MIYHRWVVCFLTINGTEIKSASNESNDGKYYGFKSRKAARESLKELNKIKGSCIRQYYVFDTLKNCKEQ